MQKTIHEKYFQATPFMITIKYDYNKNILSEFLEFNK